MRRARADLGGTDRQPVKSPPSVAALLAALNDHHAPLWRREVEEKFFAGPPGERLRRALALFGALSRSGLDPDAALVRVGRGGHAESKSVAAFREVHRPQAKGAGRYAPEGSTRDVVRLDDGAPVPLGWMLLVRADRWRPPAAWLPPPGARTSTGIDRRGTEASTRGSTLFFRKGDWVVVDDEEGKVIEDVHVGMDAVRINFDWGEDQVPVAEVHRP